MTEDTSIGPHVPFRRQRAYGFVNASLAKSSTSKVDFINHDRCIEDFEPPPKSLP
jgi:hypothetical protein